VQVDNLPCIDELAHALTSKLQKVLLTQNAATSARQKHLRLEKPFQSRNLPFAGKGIDHGQDPELAVVGEGIWQKV
jgi:hypothetical protein